MFSRDEESRETGKQGERKETGWKQFGCEEGKREGNSSGRPIRGDETTTGSKACRNRCSAEGEERSDGTRERRTDEDERNEFSAFETTADGDWRKNRL